jgi:hypothetical protein
MVLNQEYMEDIKITVMKSPPVSQYGQRQSCI